MNNRYYGVWDTSDRHWELDLGIFTSETLAEKAADSKRGYWKERYRVYFVQDWELVHFHKYGMKEKKKMNEKKDEKMILTAEGDTWGVWDTETNSWVEDIDDSYTGRFHKRQNINQRHAENAANKMNGYFGDRYEARDMAMEKSLDEGESAPVLTLARIQEEIDNRKGTIAHLEDEIKALELAAMLLGVK